MREFDLLMPTTLQAALDTLSAKDPTIQPLAGGTDVIVDVRARRTQPKTLVALAHVSELRGVTRANGILRIGAATTLAEFLKHPLLIEHASLAARAARVFANPMIRNLATLGGNIGSASPAGDLLPPLLALDAQIELVSTNGTRTLALADFFLGPRKTTKCANELIFSIQLPIDTEESPGSSAFYKLGLRQADAIAVVSVAAWLQRDGDTIRDVRIALGAVAPRPMRATRAEEILRGQKFSESITRASARLASEECAPIDDLRGSATYRRRMVQVYVRRMLEQAWWNF